MELFFVSICEILGFICIILNVFVVFAVLKYRRRVFNNVFYLLEKFVQNYSQINLAHNLD